MDQTNPQSENGLFRTALELSKARLSILVVWTTATGAIAARGENHPLLWKTLLLTVTGTALAAASASVLNQVIEAHRDAKMERTERRPIPRAAIGPGCGVAAWPDAGGRLGWFVVAHRLVATRLVHGHDCVVRRGVYAHEAAHQFEHLGWRGGRGRPPHDWMGVGSGEIDGGAWVLAGILFVWQIPHFLALAWMYRDDYARGGFQMLPAVDPDGVLTSRVTLIGSLALIPVSLSAFLAGFAGPVYAAIALVCGLLMVVRSLKNAGRTHSRHSTRGFSFQPVALAPDARRLATGW